MDHTLLQKVKNRFLKFTCIFLLTLGLVCCTVSDAVVYEKVDGEVVALFEVCDKLDTQLELYKSYINNKQEGTAEYYARLFEEKCILFPFPVLAKLVKLEFKGPFYDGDYIEIWKVIFDEGKKGEEVTYFWTAIRKKPPKEKSKKEVAA
jgi:hypothetical protein